MTTTAMNDTYINALLADASYVDFLRTGNTNSLLATRLTQPLANFITDNFEVLNQENSSDGGFDAVVWRGKTGTDYAGKIYVSMRGTQEFPIDGVDDAQLAATGITYSEIANMVNWWLRETTPARRAHPFTVRRMISRNMRQTASLVRPTLAARE